MKIGIYSDVHFSSGGNALPMHLFDDSKYTTRLTLCSKSIMWAYDVFQQQGVDFVINCGDTFNTNRLNSEEISCFKELMVKLDKYSDVNTLATLVGNHDMYNNDFNVSNIISDDFTLIVQDYAYFKMDDVDVYLLSYKDNSSILESINSMLNEFPRQGDKSILFMHQDVVGAKLGEFRLLNTGIKQQYLIDNFDVVINGHIHNHDVLYDSNDKLICNIGSLTTHSFADSNAHIGGCYIFDTDTNKIETFINPHQILFRSIDVSSNESLDDKLQSIMKHELKTVIKIKCDAIDKEQIESLLQHNKLKDNIVKVHYIVTYNKDEKQDDGCTEPVQLIDGTNNDLVSKFKEFLQLGESLKTNYEVYDEILEKINEGM